jgi:pyruvate formate lyase activating enzyme
LAERKRSIWLRFVLVPGLTDDMNEILNIAKFAAKLGNVDRVDVLPFHQMGKFKWETLGMKYTLTDVKPPSRDLTESVCNVFRSEGLKA